MLPHIPATRPKFGCMGSYRPDSGQKKSRHRCKQQLDGVNLFSKRKNQYEHSIKCC